MLKKYTLENKPKFQYGQTVKVDIDCFGRKFEGNGIMEGKIVGLSQDHILDMWMVDFGKPFSAAYPYHVVNVQHTFILDEK